MNANNLQTQKATHIPTRNATLFLRFARNSSLHSKQKKSREKSRQFFFRFHEKIFSRNLPYKGRVSGDTGDLRQTEFFFSNIDLTKEKRKAELAHYPFAFSTWHYQSTKFCSS